MTLADANIVVIDVETAVSADDCRHCGQALQAHYADGACTSWTGEKPADDVRQFTALGWRNPPALGLSIGAYWDYQDMRIHWVDGVTLEATVLDWVTRAPLMVSFNGLEFDFLLLEGLLRQHAETLPSPDPGRALVADLCDQFHALCATSYDVLAAIWRVDPARKFERGLTSLDALSRANGLGGKLSHGAQAPRDWRAGRIADVLNYCQDDVLKTKALFELVLAQGSLLRGDGLPLALPAPEVIA